MTKRQMKQEKRRAGSRSLGESMLANPLPSAAIAVTILWSGTVAVNAAFLQPDTHPAPLIATRGMPVLPATSVRGDRPISDNGTRVNVGQSDPLVEQIQIALSEKNFYQGGLDGQLGRRTRAAIVEYQEAARLAPDGEPTGKLLAHIRMSSVMGSSTDQAPIPRSAPGGEIAAGDQLLSRIQAGLKAYNMPELEVDGIYGSQTAEAIALFERQQGMPVTGQPNSDVLRVLIEIGAL